MYKHYLCLTILLILCAAPVLAGTSNVVTISSSPNAPILPDNGCLDDTNTGTGLGGITDAITFTDPGVIEDVNVRIEITTTWRSDVQAAVTYTDGGGVVLLANNTDTSGDNFFATFDSEGALPCGDAANCGTTTNCVTAPGPVCQPITPLTVFNNLDCPGTFTLAVCDRAAADAATLVLWEVTVTGTHIPVELQTFTVN